MDTYNEGISGLVAVKERHSGQVGPTFRLDTDLYRVVLVQDAVVLAVKPEKEKFVFYNMIY